MENKILVLGSSSWLGCLLLEELSLKFPNAQLAGTVYKQKLDFHFNVKLYHAKDSDDYKSLLNDFKPTVIVNFLRGEDNEGLILHKTLIDYTRLCDAYYVYASSALALDAYEDMDLTEELLANGKSEYGLFKATCEQYLYDSVSKWCILRFASVQGWVEHKLTRNENLLMKLSKGEKVIVDQGVYQNRMLANLMVRGIVDLINYKTEGIIHFGTIDNSDEVHFLKKQAEIFGYSPNLIISSENARNTNLVCIPNRIYSVLGDEYKVTETDTLQSLKNIEGLRKYQL